MGKFPVALAMLALVVAASCRRQPIVADDRDAGADVGTPSIADARGDAPVAPTPDGRDGSAHAFDGHADTFDAPPAICPAGALPVEECGCGCCGGIKIPSVCYFPARGQTRASLITPPPPPESCRLNGCVDGVTYVCCADPGEQPRSGEICARDTSIDDRPRFTITRRDGGVCTTLELGPTFLPLEIVGPPGYANVRARRGSCDGSASGATAIAGFGQVTPSISGTTAAPRYDVHVALFFDNRTGVADAVRIDADDVAVEPRCTASVCPVCGVSCALDATYRVTSTGGLGAFRDSTVLAPPASYVRVRKPEALPVPEMSCAPAFPACGGSALDVADVVAALADADVQEGFARSAGATTLPFYGEDQRGGDGPASQITRDGGGGFLIGANCPSAPTRPCTPIPPGIVRLLTLLRDLDQQQLADPSCAGFRF